MSTVRPIAQVSLSGRSISNKSNPANPYTNSDGLDSQLAVIQTPHIEFPPEPLQTPFIYSAQHMSLPLSIRRNIPWITLANGSRDGYQELMHAYIHKAADRLAAISPCYIELWRSYVPTMAFGPQGSGALLNAMVALAAWHIASSQRDPDRGHERATRYYFAGLQEHHRLDADGKIYDDAGLATLLLFAQFEVTL